MTWEQARSCNGVLKHFRSVICIVLDGVGVGEAPDADRFGDVGSNSLGNTARRVGALRLPALEQMGLGNVADIAGVVPKRRATACWGKMAPAAAGKDSTAGHWELMGCVLREPFPTYPFGFPEDLVDAFEQAMGRRVLGNRAASGTLIIEELGEEHLRTGCPIVYTSQDSVLQIAAHEKVASLEQLYRMCEIARRLLVPPHGVARVIARPFAGSVGAFYRTPARKDFSLPPVGPTLLDAMTEETRTILAIGKIGQLFAERGITRSISTTNNRDGMNQTLQASRNREWDFIFVNLVDFDTMWGHRNDPRAYALGLEEFDSYLNGLLHAMQGDALLLITSDHGNDPTTESTDHSREYVPLLAYHPALRYPASLGTRATFADVASTIAENFDIRSSFPGTSFLSQLS